LRLPHFLDDRLTDGGEVVSFTRQPSFTSNKIPGIISVTDFIDLRALLQVEGLGELKIQ
jgi:hypothetical protein